MPNKLNNGASVVSLRDAIPICATYFYEFAKNANPGMGRWGITSFHFNLFGDNRGCVFECGNFGCRTFLFYREREVRLMADMGTNEASKLWGFPKGVYKNIVVESLPLMDGLHKIKKAAHITSPEITLILLHKDNKYDIGKMIRQGRKYNEKELYKKDSIYSISFYYVHNLL